MAELLRIDVNTRAEAVRRRLARLEPGPVAVILPDGWTELDNVARLRLLQRQAQMRHQELALVTGHLSTRRRAEQLGIPVYAREASLTGRHWRMQPTLPPVDRRSPAAGLPDAPPWRSNGEVEVVREAARPTLQRSRRRRIAVEKNYRRPLPFWVRFSGYCLVGLFVLAFLGAFFLYVLPAATVTVVPGQREVETSVVLTADPQLEVADLDARVLPARLMEIYVEETGSTPTSGSEQAAVQPAAGTVVFTNQTNRTVGIPAGTIVSTSTGSRVDFRTREAVEIPAPAGTRASVAVEATEPGAGGNVRANTITTVSGALQTQVRVTNPAATSGGQSALVQVVTQADKERLVDELYARVEAEAYARLSQELRQEEWLPPGAIQTFITDQTTSHFTGESAAELSLTLRVLVRGTAVDGAVAQEAAMQALEEAVPRRGKLVADSIRFAVAPEVTVDERRVRFRVVGRGNYVIPIDIREVRSAVAGLSPEEATALLERDWLLAQTPTFYQDPAWLGTLPRIPTRIQVRVEFDRAVGVSE